MSSTRTISVTLPSEIIYVNGTVNGTDYTWTLIDSAWTAAVNRAANDTYLVELQAVNAAGTSSALTLTLYYGVLSLITDRTMTDVLTGTDKGFYNASDLNRVGAAVKYIAERLTGYGYAVNVSPKTDWPESDTPTASQMETYRGNIASLRAVIAVMASTPETPESMRALDYVKANDIERILQDLDTLITNMEQAWFFSGDLYAGET